MTEIHGFVAPGFESVRDAFAGNFESGLECGASVAVTRDGEPVVDLWAGDAGPDGQPWQRDTIVNVYSTTKTMAAISVLVLADRGALDLQAPVARYWPEFAQQGKQEITVAQVMSHSAGLPGFSPPLQDVAQLYDWDAICQGLAAMEPWWQPGTVSGYHALTQGYLQGEIVRRVDGRSIGNFFREEIAAPLGADFHIGLDPKHDDRVAELIPPGVTTASLLVLGIPLVFGNGFGLNDPTLPIGPNPRSFFWGGWGGSLGLIDLDARVSIAYVMNRMEGNLLGDPRGFGITGAVYASLGS